MRLLGGDLLAEEKLVNQVRHFPGTEFVEVTRVIQIAGLEGRRLLDRVQIGQIVAFGHDPVGAIMLLNALLPGLIVGAVTSGTEVLRNDNHLPSLSAEKSHKVIEDVLIENGGIRLQLRRP